MEKIMEKEKTLSEINEVLWKIYMERSRIDFELFVPDPNPMTIDDLRSPIDHLKIEQTNDPDS